MNEKDQMLLVFIIIIIVSQLLIKSWSLLWNKVHKFNLKYFKEKNGLEEFYFSVYLLLYFSSLGIIYAYTALNFYIGYYIFIVIGVSVILSVLLYKRINPSLTKLIINENYLIQSRMFGRKSPQKALNNHYYCNTFYQFSIILNFVIVIAVYLFIM